MPQWSYPGLVLFANESSPDQGSGAASDVAPGATITNVEASFLLSDDGVNVNAVILPTDGGWSAA